MHKNNNRATAPPSLPCACTAGKKQPIISMTKLPVRGCSFYRRDDFDPQEGSFEANPPFCEGPMQVMAEALETVLLDPARGALSFVVVVPACAHPFVDEYGHACLRVRLWPPGWGPGFGWRVRVTHGAQGATRPPSRSWSARGLCASASASPRPRTLLSRVIR
jgi:hypothetical protein